MTQRRETLFVPVRVVARRLGVPVAWLRREAETGGVPAIRTGRLWLVHLEGARGRLLADAEHSEREEVSRAQ